MTSYVLPPPPVSSIAVAGSSERFPVRRILCVGRNYEAHAREMGKDPTRDKPFFFMKPADSVRDNGADIPYPPLTKNFHYEIELVLAIGKEAFNVDEAQALGRAETLREAVRTLALDGIADPVSISCGVAVYPKHGGDGQALLRAADDALYASKRGGRDRSTVAQPAAGAD